MDNLARPVTHIHQTPDGTQLFYLICGVGTLSLTVTQRLGKIITPLPDPECIFAEPSIPLKRGDANQHGGGKT